MERPLDLDNPTPYEPERPPSPQPVVFQPEAPSQPKAEPYIPQGASTPSFSPNIFDEDLPSEDHEDKLLYEGAPITLHESYVSILTLAFQFRLTGVCLQAVLDLIQLHCPKTSVFKSSLYLFKKYFSFVQNEKAFTYYCSLCFKECDQQLGCQSCEDSKLCYLVKLSVINQLKTLINRDSFYSKLRFSLGDHSPGVYKDIYDGKLYQQLVQNGFLGKDAHLSLQWYTDGAALFKSSTLSVWPLYLTINELPYGERFYKEHVLVPAIFCGPVKPPPNLLLKTVYKDLESLHQGVPMQIKDVGLKNVRAFLLCGTGDSPARALVLNMVQHNGAFSCQKCEQEGNPRPDCPGVRIFPYVPAECVPRTLDKMIQYGRMSSSDVHVMGCKGPTILEKVCPDFVSGTAIDWMHQMYGGVWKKLLKLQFSSDFLQHKFNFSARSDIVSERLKSIKPPSHVPRMPRSLSDMAYMKMSELKFFFLCASMPVLEEVLPEPYLSHTASLVAAAQLLNADTVTEENIQTARNLLDVFTSKFSDLYDEKFMTLNFHLNLHLADLVQEQGPAWVYSCFPLESINGTILSLVSGTRFPEKQIASSIDLCFTLPDIVSQLNSGETKNYCKKLLSHRSFVSENEVDGPVVAGQEELSNLQERVTLFLEVNNLTNRKIVQFHSFRKGIFMYVAVSKRRATQRDSSVAVYADGSHNNLEVGIVHKFLNIQDCECMLTCDCLSGIFAIIERLEITRSFSTLLPNVYVPNTNEYVSKNDFRVVSVSNLCGVCTKMNFGGKLYISKPPNSMERE